MAWSVEYDPSDNLVEVIYSGSVSATDLHDSESERVRLQDETGVTRVILNAFEVENLNAGILGVLDLPSKIYEEKKADRATRIAVVLPQRHRAKGIIQFYETASRNRGWLVKSFDKRETALVWLKNG